MTDSYMGTNSLTLHALLQETIMECERVVMVKMEMN